MGIYSHSKLSTFEQCPYKFKLRYIDRVQPEIEKTIEAHLGSVVHDALEWLYTKVKGGQVPTLDEIIIYYSEKWKENYVPEIVIVREELFEKDYFSKGIKFLIDYYTTNQPFNDNTLELEKKVILELENHKIIGYIDRLVYNKRTKKYEIHDYKTANSLPTKEKVENDRQLALYSIAIKELFGHEHDVVLIWHYLAHRQKIISTRTNLQLENLKKEILELIKKIESSTEFPTCKSTLCNWCEYKSICPAWGNKPLKKSNQSTLDDFPFLKKYVREE